MAECERLIKSAFLDEKFFDSEIKDDYEVSTQMKKVWAIELDLLRKFIEVCEKYNFKYFIADGTLLGAVRHNGFIPWDDDVDVWMPREDYNKLLEVDPSEFEDPYFLQTTLTDDDYYCPFARLRNSNTKMVSVSEKNNCNNGIYIDIIPLDGISNSDFLQNIKCRYIHFLSMCGNAYCYNVNKQKIPTLINKILHIKFLKFDIKKWYKKLDGVVSSKKYYKSKRVGEIACINANYSICFYNKSDFESCEKHKFENLEVNIPAGYDNILTRTYGNYMEFPSVEQRGQWHSFNFDTENSYKNDR